MLQSEKVHKVSIRYWTCFYSLLVRASLLWNEEHGKIRLY